MSETDTINTTGIKPEDKVKEPIMYVVLVHNDPFTPRDFVVEVLQRCFQKSIDEASRIMLKAHISGLGAVGVYSYEIAETKTALANKYSHDQGQLLLFSVQEA
jgi:ATP-dependent Clp protease adaptor protein ClpS